MMLLPHADNWLQYIKSFDAIIFLLFITLAVIGVASLYSIGNGDSTWYIGHIMRLAIGLSGALIIFILGVSVWRDTAYIIYIICLALLVMVHITGSTGLGAQRWLSLGFIKIQPSEFIKFALILALARYYSTIGWYNAGLYSKQIIPIILIALPFLLVIQQPDLGTAILVALSGVAVMFLAGAPWGLFLSGIGIAVVTIYPTWLYVLAPYQKSRILTFLNSSQDPSGAGYHIAQSKIAIGSGGLWGKGFGQSTQAQLSFLPEKHTDFIFTVIAEETGFWRASLLIGLHVIIIIYGLWRASMVKNYFARLYAGAFIIAFSYYFLVNLGMVMGLLPVVGVPLPLISYGGSVIFAVMAGLGLYLACVAYNEP